MTRTLLVRLVVASALLSGIGAGLAGCVVYPYHGDRYYDNPGPPHRHHHHHHRYSW